MEVIGGGIADIKGIPVRLHSDLQSLTSDDHPQYRHLTGLDSAKPAASHVGQVYFATDTGLIYRDNGTSWVIVTVTNPAGAILPYAGSSAPSGYLLCDGSAVSRTTYAALFTVVGTTYGVGDGSTTFNLPDLRAKVPAGYKAADANFGTLGSSVGEAAHALSVAELASHSHIVHLTNAGGSATNKPLTGTTNGVDPFGSYTDDAAGSGTAHNNIQPSLTLNFIIKT